ncbi:hypothetical protein [Erwinia phage Pecta]|nr:hypothetical protein [Erwinia phage Pecta]
MAQYSDEMVRMLRDMHSTVMGLESSIPAFRIRDRLCTLIDLKMREAYLQGHVDALTEAIGIEGE